MRRAVRLLLLTLVVVAGLGLGFGGPTAAAGRAWNAPVADQVGPGGDHAVADQIGPGGD
jgi:hypothetical protein